MVNLDWRVEPRAGVTLVELTVENQTGVARRVRVANRLDGPVWPPRREGVPEAGWDDGGFEGVVPPGDRRALGYASPTSPASPAEPPTEPPVELVWTERAGESERPDASEPPENGDSTVEVTPEGVVRALGDARPPADAVPTPPEDSVPTPSRNADSNADANTATNTDANADTTINADTTNTDPRRSP